MVLVRSSGPDERDGFRTRYDGLLTNLLNRFPRDSKHDLFLKREDLVCGEAI